MDATRKIILKAHNPVQLQKEQEMEKALKAWLPGIDVDNLPLASLEELYVIYKAAAGKQ
ncbi:hypothetical protein [Pseudomonas sp. PSE14]|uniref:hypothetical protein n=1 Tax=Pseudomonas sp. PSE14 TaxID=3016341 RepID=UPI0023D8635C|nr:hypothetical protein [Pseudomonas sp. PSE14]WEJ70450.1 hypothetical protein O6P39_17435 [Pseudomonas sp. PSE14]